MYAVIVGNQIIMKAGLNTASEIKEELAKCGVECSLMEWNVKK